MTNTEAVTYIRPLAKVRFLVEVEFEGFWSGPASPVLDAVIADGHVVAAAHGRGDYRLTDAGHEHLAGFRALLAPAN